MIPISLTLKGLYSYQAEQHIDFRKLTEAQLFGIFGSVGSGKSTILEAITFALYGESERLNRGDQRNYNMMNLKSDELLIDFVFETGQNGDQYRYVVQGKRNSKHFEKIHTFDRTAYHWQNDQWVPLASNNAEDILGLSYENFKRTIIIPQGKFQEFLQLSETDRTRMLKEIFNLERFELGDKVAQVEKQNNREIDRLQGELQGLEAITEEARNEKEKARQGKQKEKEKLDKHYKQKKQRFDQLKAVKELNDQYQSAQTKWQALAEQKPEFDQRQQNLQQYEKCRYYFKDKIDRSNALDETIEKRQAELKEYKKQKEDKDKELIKQQGKLDQIKATYPEQKHLENAITDLETLIQIRQFQEELAQKQGHLGEAKKAQDSAQKTLETFKEARQDLQKSLENLRKQKLDQGKLGEIRNWFTQKQNYEMNMQGYEQEISKAREAIDQLKDQRKNLIAQNGLQQLNSHFPDYTVKALKPELDQIKGQYNQYLKEMEEQLVHYQTRQKLENYARDLEAGQPCPVCGSKEHPDKLQPGDARAKIESLQDTKKQYQEWIEAINKGLQELEGLKSQYQSLKKQLEESQEKLKAVQEQLESHRKAFRWSEYQEITVEKVEEWLNQAQSQQKEIEKLEKQIAEKDKSIEQENKALEKAAEQTKNLEQQVNTLEERINAYKQQLRSLKFEDFRESPIEDLENQLKTLQNKLKQYQTLEETIETLQKEAEALKQSLKHKQEQLEEKRSERKEIGKELQHLLDQSLFEDIGEVVKILDKDLDVDKEKEAIQDFQNQYAEQQGIVKNLEAQLATQETFQPEEFDQLQKALEQGEKQIQEFNNAIAVLNQQIEDMDQKLVRKKELNEKSQELQTRAENIKTLKNLFKGSGFVKYVSSVFLKDLCHAANERFYRLTRQQLRLEVTDNNNFQVRDFLNNGRLRSVKTLSGGQTFQASLSLALALAENIQKLTRSSQNFFFLDEGFGSQDQESLSIVFETLKSLRKEDRIVGVISHVEELKETIDVALNVENDPEKGSWVKGSWEV